MWCKAVQDRIYSTDKSCMHHQQQLRMVNTEAICGQMRRDTHGQGGRWSRLCTRTVRTAQAQQEGVQACIVLANLHCCSATV